MRSVTERGFVNYDDFTDYNGTHITVRQSSLATEAAVWIFLASPVDYGHRPPLLTREQAARLRDALSMFLEETS